MHTLWSNLKCNATDLMLGDRVLGTVAFEHTDKKAWPACAKFLAGVRGFDGLTVAFVIGAYASTLGAVEMAKAGKKLLVVARMAKPEYWYSLEPDLVMGIDCASEAAAAEAFALIDKASEGNSFYRPGYGAYVHKFSVGEELAWAAAIDETLATREGASPGDWKRTTLASAETARAALITWLFSHYSKGHLLTSLACDERLKRDTDSTVAEWIQRLPLSDWGRVPVVLEKMGLPKGALTISVGPAASAATLEAAANALDVGQGWRCGLLDDWKMTASLRLEVKTKGMERTLSLLPAEDVLKCRAALHAQLAAVWPKKCDVDLAKCLVTGVDAAGSPAAFVEISKDAGMKYVYTTPYVFEKKKPANRSMDQLLVDTLKLVAGNVGTVKVGGKLKLKA